MQPQEPHQNSEPATPSTLPSPDSVVSTPAQPLSHHEPKTYYMGMYIDSDKDYATVPWYRKTTPVILLCVLIPIVGAIILLTGNVYLLDPKTKQTWSWTTQARFAVGTIFLIGAVILALRLLGK